MTPIEAAPSDERGATWPALGEWIVGGPWPLSTPEPGQSGAVVPLAAPEPGRRIRGKHKAAGHRPSGPRL